MTTCLLHPEAEAPARCEFCDQPHCGTCLRLLLGRRYCPSCYEQVQALTRGQAHRAELLPGGGSRSGVTAPATARPVPRVPGWVSAVLYLVAFLAFYSSGQFAFVILLEGAKVGLTHGRTDGGLGNPFDPGPLPAGLWALGWIFYGWVILLAVLALTALFGHLIEKKTLGELGLRWRSTIFRDFFVGFGMAALLFISVAGIAAGKGWYDIRSLASAPEALVITVVGFLVLLPLAAVEEITIRGYVMAAASRSWGRTGAVIASTLVFAGLHGSNPNITMHPVAWVGLILAGLYLASAYLITGNLWLAIFLHTGWNLVQGPIFGLPVSGMSIPFTVFRMQSTGPDLWTGGAFGPEGGLLLCGLMVVHLATLWVLRPVLQSPLEPEKPAVPPREEPGPRVYRAIPVE